MHVLTAHQMRQAEALTIKEVGIPGIVLMERAALAVAHEILQELDGIPSPQVGIVCGTGQNGGDGFAIARMLTHRGVKARVFLLHHPDKITGDARVNWDILEKLQVPRHIIEDVGKEAFGELMEEFGEFDLWCEAIFGTGLDRRVQGVHALAIEFLNGHGAPIVSVDIPSGIHADSGQKMGEAIVAKKTVTFGQPKRGMLLGQGRPHTGNLVVADIGIPAHIIEKVSEKTVWLEAKDVRPALPTRPLDSHKGSAGRVLVFAGSATMPGAAILCARAAIVGGAGLVTLATSPKAAPLVPPAVPEVMVYPLLADDETQAPALESLRVQLDRATVVAAGPGLGTEPHIAALIRHLLFDTRQHLVLDADALNVIAKEKLQSHLRQSATERDIVLTPHPGEMARLTGAKTQDILRDPFGYATTFASTTQCVVVLKGATTVIASPQGQAALYTGGHPGMASAGMGDVLTGIVASRIAEYKHAFEAACVAVWIHGSAATYAKQSSSQRATHASSVIDHLGAAFSGLLGQTHP